MKFIRAIVTMPRRRSRVDGGERAFLPGGARDRGDAGVASSAGAVAYSAIAHWLCSFCIAAAWAKRTSGQGRHRGGSERQDHSKGDALRLIQPLETGSRREIRVHDGQVVEAGEVLIELDPTMNDADSKHLESDLIATQLDVARLQATLADGDPLANFKPPDGAPAELVAIQRKFLLDQTSEQQEKLAVLDRQSEQKVAERETIKASVDKLEASLPILEERMADLQTLFDHTTGSKANYRGAASAFCGGAT